MTVFLLAGCPSRQEKQPLPAERTAAEKVELTPVSFNELENWQDDDLTQFVDVFAATCAKIRQLKTPRLADSQIKIKTADYQEICRRFDAEGISDGQGLRIFFETYFTPYLVQGNGNADGKFTSYYEAEIRASRQRHGKYRYPVYGKPHDLIEINLRDFDPDLPDTRLVGRVSGQKMLPYYTRADIEKAPFNAPVLLWGDSAVDIHIMQIQGSAIARLDDGSQVRIGYADNNGRRFKGIGSILLDKGLLEAGKADMMSIKKWLEENPQQAAAIMQENERYIFHRLMTTPGPVGAFGIPLTAGRSLAVDRRYIPLGAVLWLSTTTPDRRPLNKMVAAQDIGSAIKGAVRGDYFWGSGGDEILNSAGRMNSSGHYYIFLPRENVSNE